MGSTGQGLGETSSIETQKMPHQTSGATPGQIYHQHSGYQRTSCEERERASVGDSFSAGGSRAPAQGYPHQGYDGVPAAGEEWDQGVFPYQQVSHVHPSEQQYPYPSPTMSEATDAHQLRDVLHKIGVGENHLHKFREQEIGIYDFLLLTREDLVELQLPIAARNRIAAFQHYFRESGLSAAGGRGWDGE